VTNAAVAINPTIVNTAMAPVDMVVADFFAGAGVIGATFNVNVLLAANVTVVLDAAGNAEANVEDRGCGVRHVVSSVAETISNGELPP
jgi:hypothetical protein